MGIALADAAAELGASVDLILGPSEILPKNSTVKVTRVTTAESMASECISRFPSCDVAILSAAVADYTPIEQKPEKMKKDNNVITLKLKPTTDITKTLGEMKKQSQILVGFALETDNEIANAKSKLKRKNLDLIILNSLRDEGAGFEHDTNRIMIIDKYNIIDKFELKSKEEAARDILDRIVSMFK
jgi:phosphopantothenoylcysteine decarboxylase/phosphopantothenate--cysteine ligase